MDENELGDIDGWLMFFILSLLAINPLFNLFLIFSYQFTIFKSISILAWISMSVLSGTFLINKKPYAISFVKIFLITTLCLNIFYIITSPEPFSPSLFMYHSLCFYYLIWIAYLYKSKRIMNVYDKLKEKENGYQIWPILSFIYSFVTPIYSIVLGVRGLVNINRNRKLKGMFLSILSIIVAMIFVFFMLSGVMYIPQEVDMECFIFCYDKTAAFYSVEHDTDGLYYNCYCTNEIGQVLYSKQIIYA